jgi:hypothetical protein
MTGGNDLRELRGWVEAPVVTLLTGNGKRDTDLNKSMESDRYPTIRFELARVSPRAEQGDTVLVDLQGNFQIHGVERTVSIPATVVLGGGAIRVRGATAMKDYRIGGLASLQDSINGTWVSSLLERSPLSPSKLEPSFPRHGSLRHHWRACCGDMEAEAYTRPGFETGEPPG